MPQTVTFPLWVAVLAALLAAWAIRFAGRNWLLLASNRWRRFGYARVNFGTPISVGA